MSIRLLCFALVILFFISSVLLPFDSAHAAYTRFDGINDSRTPTAKYKWAIHGMGWTYTTPINYTLTRVETMFGTYAAVPDNRTITILIYDEPPLPTGGTLLTSATFTWSANLTFLGGDLNPPLPLVAREDYFIAFDDMYYVSENTTNDGHPLPVCLMPLNSRPACYPASIDDEIVYPILRFFTGTADNPAAPGSAVSAEPPLPGPDMVPIPSTAVMGTFTTDTALFYAPVAEAGTPYHMAPGQSLWVFGLDATGQFYQVLLAGKFYWVPVPTLGPTYGGWWKGRPLPTITVQ